ncbi:hypothetical protein J8273_8516 [Carpediemonas membranifera]|uniref:Uncharacterized protein n=1 Tax=Carpediemonas membranifera TaxID=201153 RepID=A0A8J6AZQ2_9EUKA|nr:hypothetical protein J8273_8516 [Carpediemonas membranifera]|eukprot:KAG9389837.1 hypothetical protein J8273_8516 [Carpediemonas membranifera]
MRVAVILALLTTCLCYLTLFSSRMYSVQEQEAAETNLGVSLAFSVDRMALCSLPYTVPDGKASTYMPAYCTVFNHVGDSWLSSEKLVVPADPDQRTDIAPQVALDSDYVVLSTDKVRVSDSSDEFGFWAESASIDGCKWHESAILSGQLLLIMCQDTCMPVHVYRIDGSTYPIPTLEDSGVVLGSHAHAMTVGQNSDFVGIVEESGASWQVNVYSNVPGTTSFALNATLNAPDPASERSIKAIAMATDFVVVTDMAADGYVIYVDVYHFDRATFSWDLIISEMATVPGPDLRDFAYSGLSVAISQGSDTFVALTGNTIIVTYKLTHAAEGWQLDFLSYSEATDSVPKSVAIAQDSMVQVYQSYSAVQSEAGLVTKISMLKLVGDEFDEIGVISGQRASTTGTFAQSFGGGKALVGSPAAPRGESLAQSPSSRLAV